MGRKFWQVCMTLAVALISTGIAQVSTDEVVLSSDRLYHYAQALYEKNFLDMALKSLDQFIRRYPEDPKLQDAYVLKINSLQKLGRKEDALAQIKAFRKQYPDSPYYERLEMQEVDILQELKRYSDCYGLLAELQKSKHENTRDYAEYTLGKILLSDGKQPRATAVFKALAEKMHQGKEVYRVYAADEYAMLLRKQGDTVQALAWYGKLLALPDLPLELKKSTLYNEAQCLRALQKYAEALRKIQNYIASYPQDEHLKEARRLRLMLTVEIQDYRQALECGREWNQLYPDTKDYEVDFYYAYALMYNKNFDEALAFFARVLGYSNCTAYYRLEAGYSAVYCQMMMRQYDAVVHTCDEFIRLHPKSTKVGYILRWKGIALTKLKRYPEAESSLRKALVFFTESPEEYELVGQELEQLYCIQKQWLKASEVYRNMSKNPSMKHGKKFLLRAADRALRGGDFEAALKDLKLAATDPDPQIYRPARMKTAEIRIDLQQYQEAIAEYKTLLLQLPVEVQAEVACRIAICYFKLKQTKQADAYLKQALDNVAFKGEKRNAALFMMARHLLADKMYEQALPILNILLAVPPEQVPYLNDRFLFQAADAYGALKQHDQVNQVLNRILSRPDGLENNRRMARIRLATDVMVPKKKLMEAIPVLRQELELLKRNPTTGSALEQNWIASVLAEIYYDLKMPDVATTFAGQVLKSPDNTDATQARALYVQAAICLYYDKSYAMANQYATQCYLLMNDPVYCPKTMEISIEAFRKLNKPEMAQTVEKELHSRFPGYQVNSRR